MSVAHAGKHLVLLGSKVLESGRPLASDPDTASFRPSSCVGAASAIRPGKNASGDELSDEELSGDSGLPDLQVTLSAVVIKIAVAQRNLRRMGT